jgi:hypothetical protein
MGHPPSIRMPHPSPGCPDPALPKRVHVVFVELVERVEKLLRRPVLAGEEPRTGSRCPMRQGLLLLDVPAGDMDSVAHVLIVA